MSEQDKSFSDVEPAKPLARRGTDLPRKVLQMEVAKGALLLALANKPISSVALQDVRPLLMKAYHGITKGAITTVLGKGNNNSGLNLYRFAWGAPYTPSFENAALAYKRLILLGHDPNEFCVTLGCKTAEELLEAIKKLPRHATFAFPTAEINLEDDQQGK